MKVLLYCQYLLGMGHLFRSVRIASGLVGHQVILLAGGPEVPLELPNHVRLVRQQGLCSDETFSTLMACAPGDDLETVKASRTDQLLDIMQNFRPDVFLVEQYPFGRGMFRFELEPCLAGIRAGHFGQVKVVCSLRDILSVRRDRERYEAKVMKRMGRNFDAVLVHGDSALLPLDRTFERVGELSAPVQYTGYVAPNHAGISKADLRARLGLASHAQIVVAGFGAGRVGQGLAETLVDAFKDERLAGVSLRMFTGPLADEKRVAELKARAQDLKQVHIESYTPHFSSYVAAAGGVVGMGGYNTCMDILSARVPAIVWPFPGEPEQLLRCELLEQRGLCEVIRQEVLAPEWLAERILRMLASRPPMNEGGHPDLDGVQETARMLERIVEGNAS